MRSRQGASKRLPDVPHRAAHFSYPVGFSSTRKPRDSEKSGLVSRPAQRHGAWDPRKNITSIPFDAAGRLLTCSVGSLQRGGGGLLAAWTKREMLRLHPRLDEKLLDRPDAGPPLPTSPVTPMALRGVKQAVYELGARGFHLLAARK